MPFYDHTRANRAHQRLSKLSNQQLAEAIVQAARRLTGDVDKPVVAVETKPALSLLGYILPLRQMYNLATQLMPSRKSGGFAAKFDENTDIDTVTGGLYEIASRGISNPYNKTDQFLEPIINAVKYAQDLSDGRVVAQMVRSVRLPTGYPEALVGMGKNINPFSAHR